MDDAVPSGVETTALAGFDAVAAYLTQDEIDALAASDSVDLIVADNPVFGFDYASSLDITNLAIGLDKVAAPTAGGPTGAGVGVAVLDSGVATTSDLGSSRIVGWKDFVNKKKTPYDDAGHGTFVAGLIAGDGTASLPLDQGGSRPCSSAASRRRRTSSASRSSTAPARAARPRSWPACSGRSRTRTSTTSACSTSRSGATRSRPTDFDPIAKAVEFAWKSGITVVCAAGNEGEFGPGGILSPGDSPYVITVGASDTRQTASIGDDAVTVLQLGRPDALGRVSPSPTSWLPATG